ncbi:MAG: redoxin domain-containing protein [Candidatus Aminicenantes bacterium]|nr:redoxin domain-containing protein [Candidatus Aminicenantes bacterium]
MKTALMIPLFFLCLNPGGIILSPEILIYESLDEVLRDYQGPCLLVFFSTSCQVCWEDLFDMRYFVQKNRIEVKLCGISREPLKELQIFIEKYSIDFPVVNDLKGILYKKFQVDLEPFKLILIKESVLYRDSYYDNKATNQVRIKKVLMRFENKLFESIWDQMRSSGFLVS